MIRVFIILSILLFSCSDPTSVDAERSKTNVKNPDPNALLLVADHTNINFGHVFSAEVKSRKLVLTNVSSEEYTIQNITFERQPSVFFLNNKDFPIVLDPNQSIDIIINVNQTVSGIFEDKLIIDSPRSPSVELISTLPDFQLDYETDWEFNKGDVGIKMVKAINNSTSPIQLTRIFIADDNSNLYSLDFETKNYLEIQPKQTFSLPIEFNARFSGNYSAKLVFDIFGSGVYENIANLNSVVSE